MTQEDKNLLFIDLSARLPYGVKIYTKENDKDTSFVLTISDLNWIFDKDRIDVMYDYDGWKPYLRPMSSMTEEEREELSHYENSVQRTDFFYAHHIDCRFLIEKGLALEAPEGMYES